MPDEVTTDEECYRLLRRISIDELEEILEDIRTECYLKNAIGRVFYDKICRAIYENNWTLNEYNSYRR